MVAPGVRLTETGGLSVEEAAVVAATLRRWRGKEHVLVDVGAHHGTTAVHFVELEWEVHGFEPDIENRAQFIARFSGQPKVRIDARAVSDEEVDEATFYRSSASSGISALSPFHPTHVVAYGVPVTTLRAYLKETDLGAVTVLKVDVEGHDLPVLRGFPWDRCRPQIVICEFDDTKTVALGYDHDDLARLLVDQGYHVLVSEWYPVVEYGQVHRHRRMRAYPTDLASGRAWGNLVATPSRVLHLRLRIRFAIVLTVGRIASMLQRIRTR